MARRSGLRVWPEGLLLPDLRVQKRAWRALRDEETGEEFLTLASGGDEVEVGEDLVVRPIAGLWARPEMTCTLPDELYARELHKLDLSSAGEIEAFANEFGCLELISLLPTFDLGNFEELLAAIESETYPGRWSDADAFPALAYEPAALKAHVESMRTGLRFVAISEFRLAAQVLRDMTRIVQADAGAIRFRDVFSSWESPLDATRPATEREALAWLSSMLEQALSRVRPSVRRAVAGATRPAVLVVTPFDAICGQLFNKVSSGTGFRVCANETCDVLFGHSRAADGVARPARWNADATGLRFCCPECAHAQASRVYRRRVAQGGRLDSSGHSITEIARTMDIDEATAQRWVDAHRKQLDARRRRKQGASASERQVRRDGVRTN